MKWVFQRIVGKIMYQLRWASKQIISSFYKCLLVSKPILGEYSCSYLNAEEGLLTYTHTLRGWAVKTFVYRKPTPQVAAQPWAFRVLTKCRVRNGLLHPLQLSITLQQSWGRLQLRWLIVQRHRVFRRSRATHWLSTERKNRGSSEGIVLKMQYPRVLSFSLNLL